MFCSGGPVRAESDPTHPGLWRGGHAGQSGRQRGQSVLHLQQNQLEICVEKAFNAHKNEF